MKAERRHELETNSLALWLRFRAPELAQKHGAKILLGIIVLLLVAVLIRNRMQAPKIAAANAASYLVLAREQLDQLRRLNRVPGESGGIITQIKLALERSDDPHIQADAHLATGDYYWTLASWPEFPGSATQPHLRPAEPRDELLDKAEQAYKRVLATQNIAPYAFAAAHFGLGAIEETRAFEMDRQNLGKVPAPPNPQWAAAEGHYQQIIDSAKVPEILKEEAIGRVSNLKLLQEPVWIVPATRPATTMSTTAPASMTMPFTLPVTAPTTREGP